jgi:tRNA-dihydrouridine synthase
MSNGHDRLMVDLEFNPIEKPIVAQFFTSNPENLAKCAKLAEKMGFDGIDINMGCPDKQIEKQGAGAKLIQTPKLAQELIKAAKAATSLPVSVKTRLGFNKDTLEEWLPYLFEAEPAAITLHLRTRKEMSKVPAHWERMKVAVQMRDEYFKDRDKPLILGNGDVGDKEDAIDKCNKYGCDGVMIGRSLFGNPWYFNKTLKSDQISLEERFRVLLEHTKLYWEELVPKGKHFDYMKKHYKAYVTGFVGASELREKLYSANSYPEIEEIVKQFLLDHPNPTLLK